MKKLLGIVALAFILVGCSGGSSSVDLKGTWEVTKSGEDTEAKLTFTDSEIFEFVLDDTTTKGSYEVYYGKEAIDLVGLNIETFNSNESGTKVKEDDILVISLKMNEEKSTDGFFTDKKEDKLVLYSTKKDNTTVLTGFSGISGSNYTLVKDGQK